MNSEPCEEKPDGACVFCEIHSAVWHWLSRHKTYVALALLAALLSADIVWTPSRYPFDIDTTPCESLGLSQEEKEEYRPTRMVRLPGTPYIYCEFDRGSRVWVKLRGSETADTIGILVDTESGKRLLRLAWHNFTRYWHTFHKFQHLYRSYDYTYGFPRVASGDRPGVFLVRSFDEGHRHLFVDISGEIEPVTEKLTGGRKWSAQAHEGIWQTSRYGASLNTRGRLPKGGPDMSLLGSPIHKRLMQQDPRRVFASPQLYPEQLLFYLDGTLRTIKPDGTDEKQIFPHLESE